VTGRWKCLAAITLACLVLWGCGSDRVSGSTTETENVLTAVEFRVDSLLPSWNCWTCTSTVVTVRVDSSVLDFAKTDSLGHDLVVERQDSTPVPFEVVFWDRHAARGRLHVRIDPSLMIPGARIRLRWGKPLQVRSDPGAVWHAISAVQKLLLNSVLVDDFEQGTTRSLLPDSASWYTSHADSATVSSPALVAAGAGRRGTALHISYNAPSATFRYALTGIRLGKAPVCLRSLDSLVVWVRGSGTLGVAFDHLGDSTNSGKAWLHRPLDSSWTRLSIRPQDLDTANGVGGNVGWNLMRDSVSNLTFFASGGSDLWIDDVRLYGIDRNDLK